MKIDVNWKYLACKRKNVIFLKETSEQRCFSDGLASRTGQPACKICEPRVFKPSEMQQCKCKLCAFVKASKTIKESGPAGMSGEFRSSALLIRSL